MAEVISMSPSVLLGFLGGLGSTTGEICTFGFDNIKTRMQMNGKQGLPNYSGFIDCIKQTMKSDGFSGFYRGIAPAVGRQIVYSTVRVSIYEEIKRNYLTQKQADQFLYKFATGGFAGAVGCVVGTPFDVLKIRMISDFQKIKYRNTIDCAQKVLNQEGFGALMKGLNVNIVRAICVNAAELSGYDTAKSMLVNKFGFNQTFIGTHFISSIFAGAFGAFCSSPADVVKTRFMNQNKNTANSYSSAIDCFLKILKYEGPAAFYKGFLSYFLRIAPWNIIMWLSYEKYKAIVLPKYNNVQLQN